MTYRISVDKEACMSSGKCVAEAPEVFRFDDDELSEMVPGATQPSDEKIVDLARACPSGALVVHDVDSGEEIDVL